MQEAELSFSITGSIADIPEQSWNNLFGEEIIESYGYQKTLQESNLKEFEIHYLLAKRSNKLTGIIPFFIMDFSFTTLLRGRLRKLILYIQQRFKNFLRMKLLFIGSPTTEQFYLGVSKDENIEEFLGQALKNLRQYSKSNKLDTILFYNITQNQQALVQYLDKAGFARMEDLPTTLMQIKAKSLEEYIESLGPSTRKDLRRKLRKSSSLVSLDTQIVESIDTVIDDIYKLYLNSLNESDIHFEILTKEFLINLFKNMPGVAKCFITKDNGKIVAFNVCFIKNGLCIDKIIGLDYAVANKYHLYYTTFCYNIKWCIENGIRFYQPGQGDYDAKIRLSAKLIPLFIYTKTTNPILNIFLKAILKFIAPKNFDPALKNLTKYRKSSENIFADSGFLANQNSISGYQNISRQNIRTSEHQEEKA